MLTEEQKQRLEQNRLAALKRREELQKQRINNQSNQQSTNKNFTSSSSTNIPSNTIRSNVTSSSTNQQSNTIRSIFTSSSLTNQPSNTIRSNQTNNNQSSASFRSNNQVLNVNQQSTTNLNRPPVNNTNVNYVNKSSTNPSSSNQNTNSMNRLNQNHNPNHRPNSNSINMTQIASYNKNLQQNKSSNFITPAKRPADQSNSNDKRMKSNDTQAKSPYEQVMNKAIFINVNLKLISNKEFCLDFNYCKNLIDQVKQFKTARYDSAKKLWIFKLDHYKEIIENLKNLKIDKVQLKIGEGFPENVLNLLKDSHKYDNVKVDLDENSNVKNIIGRLFEYQKEGVKFGVKRSGRLLIADDMGLGKTIQAIALAVFYFDDWPLLIVTPSSVKFQWKEALLKWVPSLRESDIKEIDSRKNNEFESHNFLVVITSYDSLHKVEQYIREPKCAILDESHMIKASSTQRFKNISKLVNKSKRLILMSGTPAMSRPIELFTQLKLLMPKVFSNKNNYINRYCDPKLTPWGKQANGCSRSDELKVILESTVMIRRMKNDVLSELPPKRRIKINLDSHLVGKDKSEMEKFVARFKGPQSVNDEDESFNVAYKKTAEIKLQPILNYLEMIIERESKFIIFAHHRSMIEGICNFLATKQKTFIKIDGSTTTNERKEGCELFQNDDSCKAAVLSITAAGVGLTLTAAQLVIFGELYFNPGSLIQAEDRVHRIGQKDSVLIEYLICPGTVDDHIWSMVQRKLETLDSLGIESNDGLKFDLKPISN